MKVLNYYIESTKKCITFYAKSNGRRRYYIKDCHQNQRDCLIAVSCWSYALRHVKNQTKAVCLAAVKRYKPVIVLVRNENMKNEIIKELY